jgi:predicted phage-related endonuclease
MNKAGKITASNFADVLTSGRGAEKWGKTAQTYAMNVALERLGVERPEVFAYALNWGNEQEEDAAQLYIDTTGLFIQPCDPIAHPDYDFVGGTPDGLLGEDGIVEIKCPYNPANHLMNLQSGAQVKDYYPQIQGYLWITGRAWCDFVSYDPRFPEHLRLYTQRVERDQPFIDNLQQRVIDFEMELVRPLCSQFAKRV